MANIYENIVGEFTKMNCKLLTTKDEHTELLKISKKTMYKLNYIASCGHAHNVFYNVFKSRGTGIICPSCKTKENGNIKRQKMQNNEISKIYTIEQEYNFIKKICDTLHTKFDVIKAFDGCSVDLIFRPKYIIEDKWVGIQVKTTGMRHLTYSFHIDSNYKDCLLLFYCCEDENMWLFPENIITNQKKVSIGYNKSKYNIYKINKDTIFDKLTDYYEVTSKFSFEKLDTPNNIYQQREKEFRKTREEKIDFIKFEYDEIEGTVYDFKIGNLKIQEKVTMAYDRENSYKFCLCKHDGTKNGKQYYKQYNIGDNDFYWLNCENKQIFFVIPEKILIDKGIVENISNKKTFFFKVVVKDTLHNNSSWLQTYMFTYENIDKERLLRILNQ
jgi:hypothetical protein